MITMNFKVMQEGFFDRKKVIDAMDKATYNNLLKFGANTRSTAQKSLEYSDTASSPGQPPHAHRSRMVIRRSKKTGEIKYSKRTGLALKRSISFLREYIGFAYDTRAKSVLIGPSALDSTIDKRALPALEYGGPSTIADHGKRKNVSIKARPFMNPAFEAEKGGLPAMWENSVR